jgi:hypothetical protein
MDGIQTRELLANPALWDASGQFVRKNLGSDNISRRNQFFGQPEPEELR